MHNIMVPLITFLTCNHVVVIVLRHSTYIHSRECFCLLAASFSSWCVACIENGVNSFFSRQVTRCPLIFFWSRHSSAMVFPWARHGMQLQKHRSQHLQSVAEQQPTPPRVFRAAENWCIHAPTGTEVTVLAFSLPNYHITGRSLILAVFSTEARTTLSGSPFVQWLPVIMQIQSWYHKETSTCEERLPCCNRTLCKIMML